MADSIQINLDGGHMVSADKGVGVSVMIKEDVITGMAVGNSRMGGGYQVNSIVDFIKHVCPLLEKHPVLIPFVATTLEKLNG